MYYRTLFFLCLLFKICLCSKQDHCVQLEEECEHLRPLDPKQPSIFVIHASGRLGNHLMAFAIVLALAKAIHIKPFVQGETADYLKRYFVAENIPVFENTYCNNDHVQFEIFNGDIDELVKQKELHTGKVLALWPWGYKEDSPVCCPADDLMDFVHETGMEEILQALQLQDKFKKHALKIQTEVAKELNSTSQG